MRYGELISDDHLQKTVSPFGLNHTSWLRSDQIEDSASIVARNVIDKVINRLWENVDPLITPSE
jgi:hypothetical protein